MQDKGKVSCGARTAAGIAGGALFGFVIGGVPWAVFGTVAGLMIGICSDIGTSMDDGK